MKAEFFCGWSGSGDELFDGLENELELLVVVGVFFFEGFDFVGEEGIGIHQPPELDERAHDGDVHLHGTFRPQHAGKHGHALLGKGVGEVLAVLPTLLRSQFVTLKNSPRFLRSQFVTSSLPLHFPSVGT